MAVLLVRHHCFCLARTDVNGAVHSPHARHHEDGCSRPRDDVIRESANTRLFFGRRGSPDVHRNFSFLFLQSTRLNTLQWDQGKIIRFGWTHDERLAVLNDEGVYRLYDLQGDYQQYSLGNEAAEMGIIDARVHEGGLVALTGSLTLLEAKGWDGGKPMTLANPGES